MHDTITFRLFQSSPGPIATWLLRRASLLTCYKEDYSIVAVVVRVGKIEATQSGTMHRLCMDSLSLCGGRACPCPPVGGTYVPRSCDVPRTRGSDRGRRDRALRRSC